MKTRRTFVRNCSLAAGSLLLPSLHSCTSDKKITGSISGPNFALGHKMRDHQSGRPIETFKEDIVIVGGGVSGLSAGRWLQKNNQRFTLLELENEPGGNSRAGQNPQGSYPLGAHYLPIPAQENKELLDFLQEINVITSFQDNLAIYNEYYLCFDPKERLYINHHWQEGLVPNDGLPQIDSGQIETFLSLMDDFRQLVGADGKQAFHIPVDESSQDTELLLLDQISMAQYLKYNKLTSPYLIWYVNYCCADDYGSNIENTSAWAGIHYFASRKAKAFNVKPDDVLTWPEGNFWLIKQLKKDIELSIRKNSAVVSVQPVNAGLYIDFLDGDTMEMKRIEAKTVIMATPQFVNQHIIKHNRVLDYRAFQYAPWAVANLIVNSPLDEKRGEPLCWDNVVYGSSSLGYVNAAHQNINVQSPETTITYYRPLMGKDCANERKQAQSISWANWKDSILEDLKPAHPELSKKTKQLDVWIWGHGMIRPQPGFIWGTNRTMAKKPIHQKIFFAHSDLSGISIFEEAFKNGINAAKNLLQVS